VNLKRELVDKCLTKLLRHLVTTVTAPAFRVMRKKKPPGIGRLLLFLGFLSQGAEMDPISSITSQGRLLLSFDLLDHDSRRSSPFKHPPTSRNLLSGER